jgi:hypothetical protein
MLSKYNYNERLKRFEPKEKKCGYCFENEAENIDNYHFVNLYNEKDRNNYILYRTVKFSEVLLGISRCKSCVDVHNKAMEESKIFSYCIIALILVGILWKFGFLALIIGGIFSFIVHQVLSNYVCEILLQRKLFYTLKEGAEINETVRDFIISGWTFKRPSA